MENLLSACFDEISSYDPHIIRKGLRRLDALFAQFVLPTIPKDFQNNPDQRVPRPKTQEFHEWYDLQEGFEFNLATKLSMTFNQILALPNNEQNDSLLLSLFDVLQGCLLFHPPSRHIFARATHMTDFVDLLDVRNNPKVQIATITTLVCALLECPINTRTFEQLQGLQTISSLFKHRDTKEEVKLKIVEFFYFYLLPEDVYENLPRPGSTSSRSNRIDSSQLRSTEQKKKLLEKYMKNIDELVSDISSNPFVTT